MSDQCGCTNDVRCVALLSSNKWPYQDKVRRLQCRRRKTEGKASFGGCEERGRVLLAHEAYVLLETHVFLWCSMKHGHTYHLRNSKPLA